MEGLVHTRSCVTGATRIVEGSHEDALSILRRTHWTDPVLTIHINSTLIVLAIVIVVSIILIIITVCTLHLFAFQVSLNLEFITSLVFNTSFHASIDITLVFADLFVV